jgi:hypothetical protein
MDEVKQVSIISGFNHLRKNDAVDILLPIHSRGSPWQCSRGNTNPLF